MRVDLRSIFYLTRNGAAVGGTEGGLATRRNVERVEEFDTIIPAGDDPAPLDAAATINFIDTLLLLPDGDLTLFFASEDEGGLPLGAGSVFFCQGAGIGVNPPIEGGLRVLNATGADVRLRGLVGGLKQELE